MPLATQKFEAEEARIIEVYADRGRNVPPDRYSRLNSACLYHMQSIERGIAGWLRRFGYTALKEWEILGVGCGNGHWLQSFLLMGAQPHNLYGIDLQDDAIAEARNILPRAVTLQVEMRLI